MSVDRLINILVTITLVQMMISIGLSGTLADIGAARNFAVGNRSGVRADEVLSEDIDN